MRAARSWSACTGRQGPRPSRLSLSCAPTGREIKIKIGRPACGLTGVQANTRGRHAMGGQKFNCTENAAERPRHGQVLRWYLGWHGGGAAPSKAASGGISWVLGRRRHIMGVGPQAANHGCWAAGGISWVLGRESDGNPMGVFPPKVIGSTALVGPPPHPTPGATAYFSARRRLILVLLELGRLLKRRRDQLRRLRIFDCGFCDQNSLDAAGTPARQLVH